MKLKATRTVTREEFIEIEGVTQADIDLKLGDAIVNPAAWTVTEQCTLEFNEEIIEE